MFSLYGRMKSYIFSRRRVFTSPSPAGVNGNSKSEKQTRYAIIQKCVYESRLNSRSSKTSINCFTNAFAKVGVSALGGGTEKISYSNILYTYVTLKYLRENNRNKTPADPRTIMP